ncbi:MAG: LysM domain-containing protein [Dehalococcoidia bacterium]|nr:LysM domain-containing protein [Dehalococcoidia bacterium]
MSYPGDEPDLEAVCEFLGLTDDPESHATYATEAHRCYRLPNPTRIASTHQETYCLGANHQNCPIYLGEGVAQTTPTATPPPQRPGGRGDEEGAVAGPPRQQRPRGGQQRQQPGQLGPRPRPGGISMPAATIGLLALAVAIVGLAFLIQRLLGDDGGETPAIADTEATQTAEAAGANGDGNGDDEPTPVDGGDDNGDGGGNGDEEPTQPTDEETPPPDDGNGNGGQGTYTVQSGDFCASIANEFGVTTDQLLQANPEINEDCTNLSVGQEIVIPQ